MTQARKFRATITSDRTLRVPDDAPTGPVLVTIESSLPEGDTVAQPEMAAKPRPGEGSWRGLVTVADDFDAPLPDDILNDFEGESENAGS